MLFRGSALRACLPFRVELGAPADIDLFLRVLKRGNLLIHDMIGCEVLVHRDQENVKVRNSGDLLQHQLDLIEAFRGDLEAAGIYRRVRRQAACAVLGAIVRSARYDRSLAMDLYRARWNTPSEMIIAAIRRVIFRAGARLFSLHLHPYLQSVPSSDGGSR